MSPINCPPPIDHQAGFSLTEIMVGLAIGMLATLVIVQAMSGFESQKRVTTGTADAQTNGSIALYTLTSEIKKSGFGMMPTTTDSALNCASLTVNSNPDSPNSLSPVSITDGVSDTITIRFGNTGAGGVPTKITGLRSPTANDIAVTNNLGCKANDVSLFMTGGACSMLVASEVPYTNAPASLVNTTIRLQALGATDPAVAVGSSLVCLGPWTVNTYSVVNGNLNLNGVPDIEGIVNIQAQYGISLTTNSNKIDQWVNPTGIWATPSVTNRNRIKAIRIAVVARNGKLEANQVTDTCSSLSIRPVTGLCAWDATSALPTTASDAPAIILTADPNWQRYRYRVFESIIPLRNIIWAKETLQ